jgi:hypothetical protein
MIVYCIDDTISEDGSFQFKSGKQYQMTIEYVGREYYFIFHHGWNRYITFKNKNFVPQSVYFGTLETILKKLLYEEVDDKPNELLK